MNFKEYQAISRRTAIYPNKDHDYIYPTLGLAGEAGEVTEKIKKILRDQNGQVNDASRQEIAKELGDVLWYMAQLATELHLSLADIASDNINKLQSRARRGQLHGRGDNR